MRRNFEFRIANPFVVPPQGRFSNLRDVFQACKQMNLLKQEIFDNGFAIVDDIFSKAEVNEIISCLENADSSSDSFRRHKDLFAIRRFLKEIPAVKSILFKDKLVQLIQSVCGNDSFVIKSIYFDKPPDSNWFVIWHQDLTINVTLDNEKINKEELVSKGFDFIQSKSGQLSAQPPLSILENIFTLRIHLDNTDEKNGALKVIPGSHRKGIIRPENIIWENTTVETCKTKSGGVMIMQPMLLHASARSKELRRRRVIHLEFCSKDLPVGMEWSEGENIG